jgi:hypothetical protein
MAESKQEKLDQTPVGANMGDLRVDIEATKA